MKKTLIIKLGYSETLDPEISRVSSLGDVLRTTVILHHFRDSHVTWLVDEKAYALLDGNRYIQRILIYDLSSVLQLQRERYDTVINFEKVPGLCALADSINAWQRFGFRFDAESGEARAYDRCEHAFGLCRSPSEKRTHRVSWQQILLESIGAEWREQPYVLGYRPRSQPRHDVGLNHAVGGKWPTKAWPEAYWRQLSEQLAAGKSVSWQQGFDNLYEYIDWIHSCRTIVTCDSLGLHLALALGKQVVVLYGPTNSNETYLYGRGIGLYPRNLACAPCFSPNCTQDTHCMSTILPEQVVEALARLDAGTGGARPEPVLVPKRTHGMLKSDWVTHAPA